MAGWMWFVIWGVLVIALIVVVVFGIRHVFRRFTATLREWEALQSTLEELGDAAAELGEAVASVQGREYGVLGSRAALYEAILTRRAERAIRKQRRLDARIMRGIVITRSAENWTSPHA